MTAGVSKGSSGCVQREEVVPFFYPRTPLQISIIAFPSD
ncbi:hypothetical protein FOCG_01076 [Fusarium oxysporum f. sp. radicis-lycopersici 26381]|uniref:Uncharacterized protein n=4 Tax=Fusarium oxysporum species complex TaxID=171631 RepID=A0A420T738_FUSOX|nr:uncharacterized protein FOIG_02979 [Fusarium odoratissimum NRRL 54006]EWZ98046.1 hypothetical protein FOWG_02307 [Fusarium oxysporum f. sp. lycopersici MN25]EXL62401.1 hypothetical protein FOCG_01076 [Fusarium oxysporum f. sp. radicis-lycopersici 26381]RKK21935.1 hypothetical protein BFJ65_g4559 [Fusarium oxysporum f. sp. cepae]RKK76873.1 hypothetical protein BFJ69_g6605 [Fusarium oxysporum]RYC95474.1 hypothetical protein BFJ63_vAg1759 [Fusarium oxysporum f. sp. narcissi]